ncbi:MAG: hypothetical protein ACJ74P_06290 [Gaiellaceae bacterium]
MAKAPVGVASCVALIAVPVLVENASIRAFRRVFVRQLFASEHRSPWISADLDGRVGLADAAAETAAAQQRSAFFGALRLLSGGGGI